MADTSENTPFLGRSDTGYEHEENHPIRKLPANEYFKRAIKILSFISSVLSFAIGGLLIATHVQIQVGYFPGDIWRVRDANMDLAIVCITTGIVTLPTIFLQLPIIVTGAVNFIMAVALFVYSGELSLGKGWPNSSVCEKWDWVTEPDHPPYYGHGRYLPANPKCIEAINRIKIFVGIDAGFGLVIGLLLITIVLLRVIAIIKTKFWQGKKWDGLNLKGWSPSGFEVSLSFKFAKLPTPGASPAVEAGREEEGRLIET